MGYTTEFTGSVSLSRKLTMTEAKDILQLAGSDNAKASTGIDAYFQWVPSEDMDSIVWDGNEKFYKYTEQLVWLCEWLRLHGVIANGTLYWQGEEAGDTGTITVADNVVTARSNERVAGKPPKPLTLHKLRDMALEQVTS